MIKVFQIIVPDFTKVSRIITCENLVTELYVIDRADKKFFSDYSTELNKPALYILVNRDKKQLYVGETDDSVKRLRNHEAKDFWTEAIVFHSTTDTLSTTEVKWLEAKTYETLKDLGYYDLSENKQTPQYPPLKRHQIYTLEPIFEEAKNYICAAGFDIFFKRKESLQQIIPFHEPEEIKVETPATTESSVWLFPSNTKYFDLEKCFEKYGQVYWQLKGNCLTVKAGDTGYIYSAHPDQAIRYSFEVVSSDMPFSNDMDKENEFVKGTGGLNSEFGSKGGRFALVKMTGKTDNRSLFLGNLLKNGLKGAPQSAFRISQEKYDKIREYIQSHFGVADESDTNNKKSRRPPFKFSMIGLKRGDMVTFAPTGIQVAVDSDNTIAYQGGTYTLSHFCQVFMPGEVRKSQAYQGPAHFTLNGKTLDDIRKEKEGTPTRETTTTTDSKAFQLSFWTQFRDKLQATGEIPTLQTPLPQYWYDVRIGRSNILLSNTCNTQTNTVAVKLYIRNQVVDRYYPALLSRRSEINNALGCEPEWDANPAARDKTIVLTYQTDLSDLAKLDEALNWMVKWTVIFYQVFSEEVKNM